MMKKRKKRNNKISSHNTKLVRQTFNIHTCIKDCILKGKIVLLFCTCSHLSVLLPYRIECCRSRVPRVKYTRFIDIAHVLIFPNNNHQQPPAHTFPTENQQRKELFFSHCGSERLGV